MDMYKLYQYSKCTNKAKYVNSKNTQFQAWILYQCYSWGYSMMYSEVWNMVVLYIINNKVNKKGGYKKDTSILFLEYRIYHVKPNIKMSCQTFPIFKKVIFRTSCSQSIQLLGLEGFYKVPHQMNCRTL